MKGEDKKEKALRPIKAVRLDTPGVKACGIYKAGQVYNIGEYGLTNDEAHRLINRKGFTEIK